MKTQSFNKRIQQSAGISCIDFALVAAVVIALVFASAKLVGENSNEKLTRLGDSIEDPTDLGGGTRVGDSVKTGNPDGGNGTSTRFGTEWMP
ncbi:MAG: hypothetical protein KDD70_01120 [Bdellovibrionales bacterium]|nr:hypothetical protein [Bdellovibrionales bacterium]